MLLIEKGAVYEFKKLRKTNKHSKVKVKSPAMKMHDLVEIAPGTTLRDIFTIVESEVSRWEVILASALGGWPLRSFIEASKEPFEIPKDYEIEHLVVSHSHQIHNNEIEHDICFNGFSHNKNPTDINPNPTINWGIEFTPVKELMHLEVKLDESVEIFGLSHYKKYDITGNNPEEKLAVHTWLKGVNQKFSLFDVMRAIFDELSWFGDPVNQKKCSDELLGSLNEAVTTSGV